jgi:hypothetical protein
LSVLLHFHHEDVAFEAADRKEEAIGAGRKLAALGLPGRIVELHQQGGSSSRGGDRPKAGAGFFVVRFVVDRLAVPGPGDENGG